MPRFFFLRRRVFSRVDVGQRIDPPVHATFRTDRDIPCSYIHLNPTFRVFAGRYTGIEHTLRKTIRIGPYRSAFVAYEICLVQILRHDRISPWIASDEMIEPVGAVLTQTKDHASSNNYGTFVFVHEISATFFSEDHRSFPRRFSKC